MRLFFSTTATPLRIAFGSLWFVFFLQDTVVTICELLVLKQHLRVGMSGELSIREELLGVEHPEVVELREFIASLHP